MALATEPIWAAIEERLRENVTDVKAVSRRFRPQYLTDELPVIVVSDDEGTEDLAGDAGDPEPTWRISGEIWIIARTVENDPSPTSQLNALVLAVRQALERNDDDPPGPFGRVEFYTSLGGRVHSLAIQRVDKGSGALAGTAVAQLQITMEALG